LWIDKGGILLHCSVVRAVDEHLLIPLPYALEFNHIVIFVNEI